MEILGEVVGIYLFFLVEFFESWILVYEIMMEDIRFGVVLIIDCFIFRILFVGRCR